MNPSPTPAAPDSPPAGRDVDTTAPIASETLLRGQTTVCITHRGVRYRLQETRAGKLILTK
ncbi:MAG: hemin uptake protein HemP [Rhodocyclaceae bacterium]|nr:hemin uptake protein HemP [Rhodocyclaceae bacterium]